MREVVVTEFISLDGVVDSPGGEAGALLVGRTSRDAFHEVWPTMKETEGGEIQVHGSATLAQGVAADGGGKQKLELTERATYSNGIQKLCYRVVP